MARARNIKPGFFTNADLLECQPIARLLFAGLWCEADRRGVLEDRPKTLKIKILPGDNCDVDALLTELAAHGFIRRYESGGTRCILVENFDKHQNPHVNEHPNTLPLPDEPGASTVLAPEQHQSDRADSLLPRTDPLSPDSGFPHDGAGAPGVTGDPPSPMEASGPTAPILTSSKSAPFDVLVAVCEELGQDVSSLNSRDRSKQCAFAKQLVEADVGPDDARRMARWLAPQAWVVRGGGVDLRLMAGQVGKWVMQGKPDAFSTATSPRGSPPTTTVDRSLANVRSAFSFVERQSLPDPSAAIDAIGVDSG